MNQKKYIKKLILETIKANISASKSKLITESKDYSFTKEDVINASMEHDLGIPGIFLKAIDVYKTMEEAESEIMPLIAQTSDETPKEFADRIFPVYKKVFDKKFIETMKPKSNEGMYITGINTKLLPIYKIIHGILLEAIEFACFEFISEINFEVVYNGGAQEYPFTFDNKIFEEIKEKTKATEKTFETDVENAFFILRDDPNYYNVKYTASRNDNLSGIGEYRLNTVFLLSPYQDFFKKNTWLAQDSDLSSGLMLSDVLD